VSTLDDLWWAFYLSIGTSCFSKGTPLAQELFADLKLLLSFARLRSGEDSLTSESPFKHDLRPDYDK